MSRGAVLSIMGLYNNDDSIFDLMEFPEGFTEEDENCVKNSILTECESNSNEKYDWFMVI